MSKAEKTTVLIVVLSLAGSFVLPLKQAEAQFGPIPVMEVGPSAAFHATTAAMTTGQKIQTFLKEFIIRPLVRRLANALENRIVNEVTARISGVKQGQPSFITNWRNYTLDSQARGNDIFRAVLADARLCPYLKTNLQTAFGADKYVGALAGAAVKVGTVTVYQNKTTIPGLPSFQNLANCTLPSDFNASIFRNDFVKGGGWDTWNKLIQPQNNFFGIYAMALDEQQKQIGVESQSSQNQSIAGGGYLGQKLGLVGGANPNGCIGTGGINRCIFVGKEVTPPKLIAELNATALGTKISRAGFGTELNDVVEGVIGAVINGLTNSMTNFIGLQNYNQLLQAAAAAANVFEETGAERGSEEGAETTANSYQACMNACDAAFESCMRANSPGLNASASGEYTSVCSDEIKRCDADCRQRFSQ